MFILNIMKHYFILTLLFLISKTVFSEVFFSAKELSNIYMQPSIESPIIYPIELGKKLILKKLLKVVLISNFVKNYNYFSKIFAIL